MKKVRWDFDVLDNEFSLMSMHSQYSTVGGFSMIPIPFNWLVDIISGTCH